MASRRGWVLGGINNIGMFLLGELSSNISLWAKEYRIWISRTEIQEMFWFSFNFRPWSKKPSLERSPVSESRVGHWPFWPHSISASVSA